MIDLQLLMENLYLVMFGVGEFVLVCVQQFFCIGFSDWSEYWLMFLLLFGLMQEVFGVLLQLIVVDFFQVCQLLEEECIDVVVFVNKQSCGEIVSELVMFMGVIILWLLQQIFCCGLLLVSDFVVWEYVMVVYCEIGYGEIDCQFVSQGFVWCVCFVMQNFFIFFLLLIILLLFVIVLQGLVQCWQVQYVLCVDVLLVVYLEFMLCILWYKWWVQDLVLNWLVMKLKQVMCG